MVHFIEVGQSVTVPVALTDMPFITVLILRREHPAMRSIVRKRASKDALP
ncbi:hypothetical protein ACJ4V0_00785 [Phreatobacter sp. HK31-P]